MFSQNRSENLNQRTKTWKLEKWVVFLYIFNSSYNFHYCILYGRLRFLGFRKPEDQQKLTKIEKCLCQFTDEEALTITFTLQKYIAEIKKPYACKMEGILASFRHKTWLGEGKQLILLTISFLSSLDIVISHFYQF